MFGFDLIRNYFGDQVGFYAAFLNSLVTWLMAAAVVAAYLAVAMHATGRCFCYSTVAQGPARGTLRAANLEYANAKICHASMHVHALEVFSTHRCQ